MEWSGNVVIDWVTDNFRNGYRLGPNDSGIRRYEIEALIDPETGDLDGIRIWDLDQDQMVTEEVFRLRHGQDQWQQVLEKLTEAMNSTDFDRE